MTEYSIRDKCSINTNIDEDTFVGIICDKGTYSVHFPLGFHLGIDDRELRRDILMLINTIGSTIGHKDSKLKQQDDYCDQVGMPIKAYLAVILDYYQRGYYREREAEYYISKRGKINWSKTIKQIKPVVQDNSVFYLDFVTKKNTVNENEVITLIHEFCVYESFQKIGWLFTSSMPAAPRIKRKDKYFLAVLREKLSKTFNDKNKELFQNMILIIQNLQDEDAPLDYKYGTYRFEYVWEQLIDRVYGISDKTSYFPRTTWKLSGRKFDNSALEPDSIMLCGTDIYVLDAKYYKFGCTHKPSDLPGSTSINKQISYGEYVANNIADGRRVFNAFLLPFDALDKKWQTDEIFAIGEATGDWRANTELFEHIQGILIDVKYLMQISVHEDHEEIVKLASKIESSLEENYHG